MSTYNTLRLVRATREKAGSGVVLDSEHVDFDELFELYDIHEKNESYFRQMNLSLQQWGDGTIPLLATGFIFSLLDSIAKNSIQDVAKFYDIVKHSFMKDLPASSDVWFKKTLTAFWLTYNKDAKHLNYWKELPSQSQDKTLILALEFAGIAAYKNIQKKKLCNAEKLMQIVLESDYKIKDFVKFNKILEIVEPLAALKINYEMLSTSLNPLKINPYIISAFLKNKNSHFDISEVKINVAQLKTSKKIEIITDKEYLNMREFYDFINAYVWITKKVGNPDKKVEDFSQIPYESPYDLISQLDKNNEFIVTNINNLKNKLKKNSFSEKVDNFLLNLDLSWSLQSKETKKGSKI